MFITSPSLEEMLKAGMHFGHRTSKWHPKMAPFIFGQRGGIHIIDLRKTQELLDEALAFITKMVAENKTVLLVGTKDQVKENLAALAIELDVPYVKNRWVGGTLTNFVIIKRLVKHYTDLKEKKETGKLVKYTKKEQMDFDKEIKKLDSRIGGLSNLKKLPDVMFIWDIKHEKTALTEARKKGVPVIAVCDTNVNPEGVKYIIPANDDAIKTIKLLLSLIAEAIREGKKQAVERPRDESKKVKPLK